MTSFRVGQKVVCVDASTVSDTGWHPEGKIALGTIYTVREVGLDCSGYPGVRLVGRTLSGIFGVITGRPFYDNFYSSNRFRPVVERKTDISIFKEILAGTRQPQGVEA